MESVKLQYRRLGRELTPERKRISRQPRRLVGGSGHSNSGVAGSRSTAPQTRRHGVTTAHSLLPLPMVLSASSYEPGLPSGVMYGFEGGCCIFVCFRQRSRTKADVR